MPASFMNSAPPMLFLKRFEASLQLSEAALVGIGIPTGRVIASIHEKRDEFRLALQGAGGYRGHAGINSARGKLSEMSEASEHGNNTPEPAGGDDATDVEVEDSNTKTSSS